MRVSIPINALAHECTENASVIEATFMWHGEYVIDVHKFDKIERIY